MRPSFVNLPKPFIVGVVTASDPDSAIANIRNSECDGAQAFDLHLLSLERQYHNVNDLERIIKSTHRPIMTINYRGTNTWTSPGTDEERVEAHLMGVKAGSSACDLMGDLFDPSPMELTHDPTAIDRQRRLIDQIHSMGAEVIMSSHTWVPMTAEQVVEHLKQLEARGADMVKIAASVNNEEELLEAFRTTVALKNELKIPFIHICMGQYGKLHRCVGPMLGSALTFCVKSYTPKGHKEQPLVRAAKAVFDNLDYHVARSALEDEK